MVSVLLRFRDFRSDIDTISAHKEHIKASGKVHWGWWRKEGIEPDQFAFLARLKSQVDKHSVTIGIFDRSVPKYYEAELCGLVHGDSTKEEIPTPEKRRTPKYYSAERLPAWFELSSIKEVTELAFKKRFGSIPTGKATLHPIQDKPVKGMSVLRDADYVQLASNHILHVSDVHFGDDYGYVEADKGKKLLADILKRDLPRIGFNEIGLIVQSGDLTSRGDVGALQSSGLAFMEALRTNHRVEKDRILMIPGNHDYALKTFKETNYDHEKGYALFLKEFYESQTPKALYKYKLPSGRRLEILPIDSVKLRKKATSNFGWVEWNDYEHVLEAERGSLSDPSLIRIAVIHHHLAPAPRVEPLPPEDYPHASVSVTLNAGEVVEGLQEHGFTVVLHGHQHTPAMNVIGRGRIADGSLDLVGWDHRLYLLAGGSAGAKSDRLDPGFPLNSYGVLTIENDHIYYRVRKYTSVGSPSDHYQVNIPI